MSDRRQRDPPTRTESAPAALLLSSYTPAAFRTVTTADIASFLSGNRFGSVVTQTPGRWSVSHLPLTYEFDGGALRAIRAHVAKANPQSDELDGDAPVLITVQGPDAHIVPEWYEDRDVPTWDYAVVHVSGTATHLSGPELMNSLGQVLASFDGGTGAAALAEYPPGYIEALAAEVVGIEVRVGTVLPVFKLSQDKSAADLERVADGLDRRHLGGADVALSALLREHGHRSHVGRYVSTDPDAGAQRCCQGPQALGG
jgi:transcriptional regulator